MKRFFKKPYAYAAIFSAGLLLFFAFSLLKVFIIPVELEIDLDTDETLDINRFAFGTAAEETVAAETTFGMGHIGGVEVTEESSAEETTVQPETEPEENYPIIADNYYKDENICVEIKERRMYNTTYYVADIRVSSVEYLKTALAKNKYGLNITETVAAQAKRAGAIVAINGDYYGANEQGYVIRNGVAYRDTCRKQTKNLYFFNDLAIYTDGTFGFFSEKTVSVSELIANGVYHTFAFGPELVTDGEIAVGENQEVKTASGSGNPRTAIGIIEPLHYIFVVSDGRTSESNGFSLYELADVMRLQGCTVAYNLDGGGSSTLWFNGKVVNNPTTDGRTIKERAVSDIVYIGY